MFAVAFAPAQVEDRAEDEGDIVPNRTQDRVRHGTHGSTLARGCVRGRNCVRHLCLKGVTLGPLSQEGAVDQPPGRDIDGDDERINPYRLRAFGDRAEAEYVANNRVGERHEQQHESADDANRYSRHGPE